MKSLFAALILCLLASGTTSAEKIKVEGFADEIRVEGGGTAIATVFLPIKSRFESLYGHKLTIVQSTAVKGLIALHEGKVDIATGAHPLDDLITGAAKAGVVIDRSELVATRVEDNRLVVITNRSNGIKALSDAQLKGIYSGTILNWHEVGGPDLAIQVVWGKETQGQNVQFSRIVLAGEPVTAKVHEVTDYRSIFESVQEAPGAIGVVPLQMSSAAVHVVDARSIVSSIYVITKGAPSEKVQQVIDFYNNEFGFLKE